MPRKFSLRTSQLKGYKAMEKTIARCESIFEWGRVFGEIATAYYDMLHNNLESDEPKAIDHNTFDE